VRGGEGFLADPRRLRAAGNNESGSVSEQVDQQPRGAAYLHSGPSAIAHSSASWRQRDQWFDFRCRRIRRENMTDELSKRGLDERDKEIADSDRTIRQGVHLDE